MNVWAVNYLLDGLNGYDQNRLVHYMLDQGSNVVSSRTSVPSSLTSCICPLLCSSLLTYHYITFPCLATTTLASPRLTSPRPTSLPLLLFSISSPQLQLLFISLYIILQYLLAGLSLRAITCNACYAEYAWFSLDATGEIACCWKNWPTK